MKLLLQMDNGKNVSIGRTTLGWLVRDWLRFVWTGDRALLSEFWSDRPRSFWAYLSAYYAEGE